MRRVVRCGRVRKRREIFQQSPCARVRRCFCLSLLLLLKDNNNKENNRAKTFAFAATAFDAICSDVLFDGMSSTTSALLHCGNFGIVLLNAAWCFRNGERAYDLLEKMINVTMMRGAQSGGIVTFEEQSEGKMRGVRSRVVNMKRTDSSKLLRSKTERESKGKMNHSEKKAQARIFCGHTRFATTSKATFDGTHPHQWSPKQNLVIYGLKQTHLDRCVLRWRISSHTMAISMRFK